jgi:HD-GYP domain-containing protein (c-di-GMP phosphodiesterase class II)
MNELAVRSFLTALLHAGERMRHHPSGDSSVEDAVVALMKAAEVLTVSDREVTLTLSGDAVFLGSEMLPHVTVGFNGMISEMRRLGIDSITLIDGADRQDLVDLAAVIGGVSNDLPVGGTVRLNERPLAGSDLHVVPVSELRTTYAASLETLRGVSAGGRLELHKVAGVVEGFLGKPAASSLTLATLRNYDEMTFYHSVNVCLLTLTLGRTLSFDDDALRYLGTAALLHDLGRMLLGETALSKKGSLTTEERAQVRLHPQEGAQAILAASGPGHEIAAAVALEHHARVDGAGYPDLGGRTPHLFSRMVAVADSYDAITSRRPHRPARTPHAAMQILADGAGTAFDSDVVEGFVHMMGEYPPGSLLRIDGGEMVMVTGNGSSSSALMVSDSAGRRLEDPEPVELTDREIIGPVLADEAGIEPAEMLEAVEA